METRLHTRDAHDFHAHNERLDLSYQRRIKRTRRAQAWLRYSALHEHVAHQSTPPHHHTISGPSEHLWPLYSSCPCPCSHTRYTYNSLAWLLG